MTSILEWGEPPADGRSPRRKDWAEVAAILRDNPGQWAKVHTGRAYATQIVRGLVAGFKPYGAFEAVARETEESKAAKGRDRSFDTWARFVGLPDRPVVRFDP